MWLLQKLGVTIAHSDLVATEVMAQVHVEQDTSSGSVVTIANDTQENKEPGEHWLQQGGVTIRTEAMPPVSLVAINFELSQTGHVPLVDTIELTDELNGAMSEFGARFWTTLFRKQPKLGEFLVKEEVASIEYSDRYIQSPSAMLLVTQLLGFVRRGYPSIDSVVIRTLFHDKPTTGHLLHHDWQDKQEFVQAYEVWGEHVIGVKPRLHCVDKRSDIAHRRALTLTLKSGEKLVLKFDQGVGYWRISEMNSSFNTVKYPFQSDIGPQLVELKSKADKLTVSNSEQWSTDVTFSVDDA
ncbi:hypothetical protein [Vibrio scophthalmi]|uniref:hypothetical protein n=1 Tax=Vibrio scophthalmi TaxID=45658 RepID=UPI002FF0EE76